MSEEKNQVIISENNEEYIIKVRSYLFDVLHNSKEQRIFVGVSGNFYLIFIIDFWYL